MEIIGHRGASGHAPDNSKTAFEIARGLGATWVELDLRRLGDGTAAVSHEPLLADGRRLSELSASELPDDVLVPDDAFEAAGDLGVNIEIKNSSADPDFDPTHRLAALTVELVTRRQGLGDDRSWSVSCFDGPTLDTVRDRADRFGAHVPTAFLLDDLAGRSESEVVVSCRAGGHHAIHPQLALATPSFIDLAHDHDLDVNVWTVNEPHQIERLISLGADGIVTDYPDRVRAALARPH